MIVCRACTGRPGPARAAVWGRAGCLQGALGGEHVAVRHGGKELEHRQVRVGARRVRRVLALRRRLVRRRVEGRDREALVAGADVVRPEQQRPAVKAHHRGGGVGGGGEGDEAVAAPQALERPGGPRRILPVSDSLTRSVTG